MAPDDRRLPPAATIAGVRVGSKPLLTSVGRRQGRADKTRQILRRTAFPMPRDVRRRTGDHDATSVLARAWADIDHMIAVRDKPHIMLYHHHRVSGINQSRKLHDQPYHIRRM